jgi:hypothetical protein
MAGRVVFLCAQGSSRAYLAASLLMATAGDRFDAWATPTQEKQGLQIAQFVLQEQGLALLPAHHLIVPTFSMRWDQGIVLCSGATDT